MATKRTGVQVDEQMSEKEPVNVKENKTGGSRKPARKLKNLDDDSASIRWVLTVLVFALALLCLIYYYNYYQPKLATPTSTSGGNTAGKNPSGNNKEPIKTSKGKSKDTETKNKPQSNKKPKPNKASKPKTSTPGGNSDKPKSNKPIESSDAKYSPPQYPKEKLENLAVFPKKLRDRLLRLPIPPSDADRPLAMEIVSGDDHLANKDYSKALESFNAILKRLPQSPRGLYGKAMALESIGEKRKNTKVLDSAIEHYRKVSLDSFLAPEIIKETCLIRLVTLLNILEKHEEAITTCQKLCAIDSDNDGYAIQLSLTYIRAGRLAEAKDQLLSVLDQWPANPVARGNLGYLYYLERDCSSALPHLMAGLEGDEGIKKNSRFYLYAGECLVKLNMYNESLDLYKVAVDFKLFPSLWQRPLFLEKDLRAQPWWNANETGLGNELETVLNGRDIILSEILPIVQDGRSFVGSPSDSVWTLYSDGHWNEESCHVTPQSCGIVGNNSLNIESKVLLLPPSLHIPPNVASSTNTRLRAVLPLKLPQESSLIIRVADKTRELSEGVLSVIDGSFEQELWHKSNQESCLLLIMELSHPDYRTA